MLLHMSAMKHLRLLDIVTNYNIYIITIILKCVNMFMYILTWEETVINIQKYLNVFKKKY